MRLLTWLCLLLVLSNVVVYFWPDKSGNVSHVHSPKEEINPGFVKLQSEVEDKFYTKAVTKLAQSSVDVVGEKSVKAQSGQECYRVGPFLNQVNYELAQAVLFNTNVSFKKSMRESQESNVYRVFLGPFSDREQVNEAKEYLKERRVLDHFVRKREQGDYIVSLGIYTTDETVLEAVQLLKQDLEGVKFESELVLLPESYWLHFAIEDENQIHQQLAQVDWGEPSAKMGKYECRQ